jgi:hypothetical protein
VTIEITYEKALSAMRGAVADRGADYVYPESEKTFAGTCQYLTEDGRASCLVGEVLVRVGVPAESLPKWIPGERSSSLEAVPMASSLLGNLESAGVLTFERNRTQVFLDTAQDEQDNGQTWGVALERAEAAVAWAFPGVD